jgi:SAM-dependent methyltransferase
MDAELYSPLNAELSAAHRGVAPMMRLAWTHRWEPPAHARSLRPSAFGAHEIREELDGIAAVIRSGAVEAGVGRLRALLHDRGRRLWPGGWQILARSVVREHPVLDLIHESPFARGAFQRGGDVRTLDFLYSVATLPAGTTERGRRVAACELEGDTPRAMRAGRDLIARAIDDVVMERPHARILSVDSRRWHKVKLSADLTSLDLICSVGLVEQLSDRSATTLITDLLARLAPGGRLLVATIAPERTDRQYLEACMDWWMTCRGESSMQRLAAAVPRDALASSRTFRDRTGHVVCLELIRA